MGAELPDGPRPAVGLVYHGPATAPSGPLHAQPFHHAGAGRTLRAPQRAAVHEVPTLRERPGDNLTPMGVPGAVTCDTYGSARCSHMSGAWPGSASTGGCIPMWGPERPRCRASRGTPRSSNNDRQPLRHPPCGRHIWGWRDPMTWEWGCRSCSGSGWPTPEPDIGLIKAQTGPGGTMA